MLDSDINSTSYLSFTNKHATALLLSNIASVKVTNVTIVNCTAFGLVAVNLLNATFDFLKISHQAGPEHKQNFSGSELFVLYTNLTAYSRVDDSNGHYMQIRNLTFLKLHSRCKPVKCSILTYRYPMPAVYGAGLTIFYTQSSPAVVNVSNSTFELCHGLILGAMVIIQFNSSIDSRTVVSNSYFLKNSKKHSCLGAAIVGYFYFSDTNHKTIPSCNPLTVTGTLFSGNGVNTSFANLASTYGTIGIGIYNTLSHPIPMTLYFSNNTFYNNTAFKPGNSLSTFVIDDGLPNSVSLILESIIAYKNKGVNYRYKSMSNGTFPLSTFHFSNVNSVIINGTKFSPSNFTHNFGSVFRVVGSNLTLQGHLNFINNIANYGPAFMLQYNSVLNLNNGLNINFINNFAQSLGGARLLYANCDNCHSCTFQHSNISSVSDTDISLYFANNAATLAGDAIYSSNLYYCEIRTNPITMISIGKSLKTYLLKISPQTQYPFIFVMIKQVLKHSYILEQHFTYQSVFMIPIIV